LTDRQVAVMELAAQHKSNKVIAHELDISPSTVEQRMGYVRDKLETIDRNSTIRRFVELRTICGEPIYGITYLDPTADSSQTNGHEAEFEGLAQQSPFLEALDGRFGRWGRVGLIVTIGMAIILIALVMLSVAAALSELIG
ncbi:MAG: helix-turn-helix transcriptional regulator, partial [Erythrobacter sp.]